MIQPMGLPQLHLFSSMALAKAQRWKEATEDKEFYRGRGRAGGLRDGDAAEALQQTNYHTDQPLTLQRCDFCQVVPSQSTSQLQSCEMPQQKHHH